MRDGDLLVCYIFAFFHGQRKIQSQTKSQLVILVSSLVGSTLENGITPPFLRNHIFNEIKISPLSRQNRKLGIGIVQRIYRN